MFHSPAGPGSNLVCKKRLQGTRNVLGLSPPMAGKIKSINNGGNFYNAFNISFDSPLFGQIRIRRNASHHLESPFPGGFLDVFKISVAPALRRILLDNTEPIELDNIMEQLNLSFIASRITLGNHVVKT